MSNEFLNGLQAASNAVAGNVAGPVDILAFLLRKAGMPVPENPIGGSNWMTQKGLMAPVRQGASQVIGETAGLLGPAMVSQFGPQIARGLLKGGENLAAPRTLNPQTGAVVYHGSPHKFDKFDSSKIGTGEGAQAFGHGLYLADQPSTARTYMTAGQSVVPQEVKYGGKNADQWYRYFARQMDRNPNDEAAKAGTFFWEKVASRQHPQAAINAAIDEADDWPALAKYAKSIDIKKFTGIPETQLYKVDLPDEKIARMLDWDKPLSQQAPGVLEALRAADKRAKDSLYQNGGEYYRALMSRAAQDAPLHMSLDAAENMAQSPASQQLRKIGIPGIRYLDGGSRGAGSGTSNYVVFPGEEEALRILERNGQGLLGP